MMKVKSKIVILITAAILSLLEFNLIISPAALTLIKARRPAGREIVVTAQAPSAHAAHPSS